MDSVGASGTANTDESRMLEVTTKEMLNGMKNSQTVFYALTGKKKPCFMAWC